VLHTIFERVATSCGEHLRQYCAAPTTFFVNQVKTGNSWDILESYEDAVGPRSVQNAERKHLFIIQRGRPAAGVSAHSNGGRGRAPSRFNSRR
jgi:hypothetical protein